MPQVFYGKLRYSDVFMPALLTFAGMVAFISVARAVSNPALSGNLFTSIVVLSALPLTLIVFVRVLPAPRVAIRPDGVQISIGLSTTNLPWNQIETVINWAGRVVRISTVRGTTIFLSRENFGCLSEIVVAIENARREPPSHEPQIFLPEKGGIAVIQCAFASILLASLLLLFAGFLFSMVPALHRLNVFDGWPLLAVALFFLLYQGRDYSR